MSLAPYSCGRTGTHNHDECPEMGQCEWCLEWVDENDLSSNSDENTVPGTLGGGESLCESCRDGAS